MVAGTLLASWRVSDAHFSLVYEAHHRTDTHSTGSRQNDARSVGGELRPIAKTLRRRCHSNLPTRIPGRQHFGRQSAAHLLTAASAGHGCRDRARARVPRDDLPCARLLVRRTLVGRASTMGPGSMPTHLVLERSSIKLLSHGLSQGRCCPPVKRPGRLDRVPGAENLA